MYNVALYIYPSSKGGEERLARQRFLKEILGNQDLILYI